MVCFGIVLYEMLTVAGGFFACHDELSRKATAPKN